MKIKIVSDIHLQHWQSPKFWDNIANTEADVLVLAGDIVGLAPRLFKDAKRQLAHICSAFGDKPVLYVMGNHEFYGTWPNIAQDCIYDLEQSIPNLTWLRRDRPFIWQNRRFLGDTMWFPERPDIWRLSCQFSDFHCIKNLQPWVYQEHNKFVNYLEKELKEGDIVVTHHAPSTKSVAPEWYGDDFNVFFVVPEIENLILDKKPALWIHGHVHNSFDYTIDKTRIVCNPLGYQREGQSEVFNNNLLVEV